MIAFCVGAMNVVIGLDLLITHNAYAWFLMATGFFLMVTGWLD